MRTVISIIVVSPMSARCNPHDKSNEEENHPLLLFRQTKFWILLGSYFIINFVVVVLSACLPGSALVCNKILCLPNRLAVVVVVCRKDAWPSWNPNKSADQLGSSMREWRRRRRRRRAEGRQWWRWSTSRNVEWRRGWWWRVDGKVGCFVWPGVAISI